MKINFLCATLSLFTLCNVYCQEGVIQEVVIIEDIFQAHRDALVIKSGLQKRDGFVFSTIISKNTESDAKSNLDRDMVGEVLQATQGFLLAKVAESLPLTDRSVSVRNVAQKIALSCASQAVENLLGGHFAGLAIFLSNISQSGVVHFGLPQPARHVVFFNLLQRLGNARAAEILLGQNVRSHLAPAGGNLDIGSAENDGTIGILDFAGDQTKFNGRIRRLASFSITALNAHDLRSLFPNPNKPLLAQKP